MKKFRAVENKIIQIRTYNFCLAVAWSSAYFQYCENKIKHHAPAYKKQVTYISTHHNIDVPLHAQQRFVLFSLSKPKDPGHLELFSVFALGDLRILGI